MDFTSSIDVIILYIILSKFNTIIDRVIGGPGYCKGVVDGINACDKRSLIGKCV